MKIDNVTAVCLAIGAAVMAYALFRLVRAIIKAEKEIKKKD